FGEDSKLTEHDNTTMGMSCLLQGRETHEDIEFIAPPFAAKLTEKDFADRAPAPDVYSDYENFWYLELGGTRNTIDDTEVLRDELVGLAAGTWDYIKNSGKYDASKWDLDFLGFLPGKRESRRMSGEYTLTQKDVYGGGTFSDEIAYGGWPLDDHFPGGFYQKGEPNSFTDTPAPYSIPYRTLYSINVDNLYFAGRNISATHLAMSTTRVMATCMLLGEAVGKAAAIAAENGISPHDVYLEKMDLLQEKLLNGDCFLPSKLRKISETCQSAELSGACDIIRNGKDRGHALYGNEDSFACPVALNTEVSYSFAATEVQSVHLVFSSDLNRDTLPGGHCERIHSTRANRRLDSPQMHMPTTLCREFKLIGELDGEKTELLHVCDNRKRSYHLPLDKKFDKLTLIPIKSWGTEDKVPVVSFDFN
ncbi:MAG: FAD-dependent oxidoreductase, partial [Clostridia bacterium]|nr:FAD-dependent oxidoreductase [Clostridia bacterium]